MAQDVDARLTQVADVQIQLAKTDATRGKIKMTTYKTKMKSPFKKWSKNPYIWSGIIDALDVPIGIVSGIMDLIGLGMCVSKSKRCD